MRLMTFIEIAESTGFERMVILGVQGVVLPCFSIFYLLSE
jgi:ubiquinol oxidase